MSQELSTLLSKTALFAPCSTADLTELIPHLQTQHLQSGACLYTSGDASNQVYIVAYGRLRASLPDQTSVYINRYEIVGETGVLASTPRQSSVYAIRDSVLISIKRDVFLDFLTARPNRLLHLTQLVIERAQPQHKRQPMSGKGHTLSLIPVGQNLPIIRLAEALTRHLNGWPSVRLVTATHVEAIFGEGFSRTALDYGCDDLRLRAWFAELENQHDYVLYAAEHPTDTWAKRCLHVADRALLLAEADQAPQHNRLTQALQQETWSSPVELVLLRAVGNPSPHTAAWKTLTQARAHYFIHPWSQTDIAALARQMSGQGLCLVLGGGGARGFAHIGLIRALEQLHIPVDIVGGTSMGAFIGALVASGFDSLEMTHIAHETFVTHNYLNDYTMPRVSLIRGERFYQRLKQIFGEQRIENLRQAFYCISTNLTTGTPVVHDQGELAAWVGTSMSVPGVAPPVAWHEQLLCDGGVVNNLPTDVMHHLERGTIIASNVSQNGDVRAPGAGLEEPDQSALLNWHKLIKNQFHAPKLSEILMRTATLASDTTIQSAAIARAHLHIRMPIEGIGMFEWHRLDELVERGYQHALAQLLPMQDQLPKM
ncbi:MAG: patatin-like phospholipase family protein [Pseudomonadota bacterium]|nr:patatin-like phospholipase family protein [Pseudomonadota bacterium]